MPTTLADTLRGFPPAELRVYLAAHSGLPGPRANLPLADAFADVAPAEIIREFADSANEFERFCGTEALGRLLLAGEPVDTKLRERANDESWRVREGAARALQLVGSADLDLFVSVAFEWTRDARPLVRRAGVAGICEPRLLTTPEPAAAALECCTIATEALRRSTDRRDPGVRNLRQALGYCWSVAIAAAPQAGLAAFARLRADADSDIQWIVASNLTKARLKRLL